MTSSTRPTLVIGNKNFSSWSLRPWLLLKHFDVDFAEIRLPLDTPEFYATIGRYSPTGRVPVLQDGELVVWDSLAILEYSNERWLEGAGWPADRATRAHARAVSAEMHSGFQALRSECPMDCVRRTRDPISAEARRDVDRIATLWRDCRNRYGGPFLFGGFSIADAMYAPVALRITSYGIDVGPIEREYVGALLGLPALKSWLADAEAEQRNAHKATR
ncbi:glutathione S-transferase family protein [Tahibacter amnicola]|uniref:Glutathione S-transferase family protein n=1 Tax=Tahibacter amnicola TaxID=2976241 RepID=A0ABY6BGB0_9GAMM|nr:glutathione S-transferase family protein [Tahibacter amnicola]UXI67646.1 glutathione S-transferase family protein [Tahibacter amnicola]